MCPTPYLDSKLRGMSLILPRCLLGELRNRVLTILAKIFCHQERAQSKEEIASPSLLYSLLLNAGNTDLSVSTALLAWGILTVDALG